MDDQMITKLIQRMMQVFATKDDLQNFATKDDLKNFATKDDLKNLATKDDLSNLRVELKTDIKKVEDEVKSVGKVLTDYMDETDSKVDSHEKRIKRIESLPSIAHQIK